MKPSHTEGARGAPYEPSHAPPDACPHCGARTPALDSAGRALTFTERDASAVIRVLAGDLEERCTACQKPLGERLGVLALCFDPPEYLVVPASRSAGRVEALVAPLRRSLTEQGIDAKVTILESIEECRQALARRIARRVERVRPILSAPGLPARLEALRERWRDLDSLTQTALAVVITVPVPGVRLGAATVEPGGAVSVDDVVTILSELQSFLWLVLAEAWMRPAGALPRGASLDADLAEYVDGVVGLPGAAERAINLIGEFAKDPRVPPPRRAVAEAVRASVAASGDVENPAADEWAELYFGMEIALADEPDDAPVRALLVSEERARRTVTYRGAWDAVVRRLLNADGTMRVLGREALERLAVVAAKAGHETLLTEVMAEGRRVRAEPGTPIEKFLESMRRMAELPGAEQVLLRLQGATAAFLVQQGRSADLIALADEAAALLGGSHEAHARVDAWLGRYLKDARRPDLLLARVGREARPWEHDLPVELRAPLWTERSNALRLSGAPAAALAICEALAPDLTDEDHRQTNQLNVGILQRETGAPDRSLATLETLLGEVPPNSVRRIEVLTSLATTLLQLGRRADAVARAEEAAVLATGPFERYGAAARVLVENARAGPTAAWRDVDRAREPLRYVGVLASWVNELAPGEDPPAELVEAAREGLGVVIAEARERDDAPLTVEALRLRAHLEDKVDGGMPSMRAWGDVLKEADARGLPPDPVALVRVATFCFIGDRPEMARELLLRVPDALAHEVGGVGDLAVSVRSLRNARVALMQAAELVMSTDDVGTAEDVRLLAELQRDAVARARAHRAGTGPALDTRLDDETLAELTAGGGDVAVIEWVEGVATISGLVTRIRADGDVESTWLDVPDEIDLHDLRARVASRLSAWLPDDPGDPFDDASWATFEEAVSRQIGELLDPDGHVVVIEPRETPGIPWHVALRRWPVSYASGWARLLELARAPRPTARTLGVASVRRVRESAAVRAALDASVERAESLARAHDLALDVRRDDACDRDALVELLGQSDVAKLLCHGYVDAAGEVSLMLAAGGVLPLANSVASGSAAGAAHRVTWRDLQGVSRAPATIFSAACSSALAAFSTGGDRLGLYGALASAGARSLVAPQWDIVADVVIPVLDRALEHHLDGVPLGRAVHRACVEAEARTPRWLAWALTLEGDWQ